MIEAIAWKWTGIQISIKGEQIYSNIVLNENSVIDLPTESEVDNAIIEHTQFLADQDLLGTKLKHIELLRKKQIDLSITTKIIAVMAAKNKVEVEAV